MSLASLKRKVRNLEALVQLRQRNDTATLDAIRTDPTTLMTRANMMPDAWQEQVLRSTHHRTILLCARQ
jgi:hypothetical protein